MQKLTLLVAAVLLTAACEPVRHYKRLQTASFVGKVPRKPYGTVKVFQGESEIKRPFEVIGMMSCEGSAAEEAAIVNAMLYRAADMGADGLLLGTRSMGGENVSGGSIDVRFGWAAMIGDGNERAYRAQAIRFLDASGTEH